MKIHRRIGLVVAALVLGMGLPTAAAFAGALAPAAIAVLIACWWIFRKKLGPRLGPSITEIVDLFLGFAGAVVALVVLEKALAWIGPIPDTLWYFGGGLLVGYVLARMRGAKPQVSREPPSALHTHQARSPFE